MNLFGSPTGTYATRRNIFFSWVLRIPPPGWIECSVGGQMCDIYIYIIYYLYTCIVHCTSHLLTDSTLRYVTLHDNYHALGEYHYITLHYITLHGYMPTSMHTDIETSRHTHIHTYRYLHTHVHTIFAIPYPTPDRTRRNYKWTYIYI